MISLLAFFLLSPCLIWLNIGKTSSLCVMPCFYLFMLTIVLMHFKDLIDSQRAMLPWLTIYDNNQYSRCLPYFSSVLTDLPRDWERFLENYADSLTGNPYSGMSSDMIIEVTMNKGSKLKSGTKKVCTNILNHPHGDWKMMNKLYKIC